MHRWKIWLGLVVIFISGVLIGAIGDRFYVKSKIARIMKGDPAYVAQLILQELGGDLKLTKEEHEKVAPICQAAARDLLTIRREQRDQVDKVLERAVCDNKKQLCLDKQQQLEEHWEKFKSWRASLAGDLSR
jgi:hypothetical protein